MIGGSCTVARRSRQKMAIRRTEIARSHISGRGPERDLRQACPKAQCLSACASSRKCGGSFRGRSASRTMGRNEQRSVLADYKGVSARNPRRIRALASPRPNSARGGKSATTATCSARLSSTDSGAGLISRGARFATKASSLVAHAISPGRPHSDGGAGALISTRSGHYSRPPRKRASSSSGGARLGHIQKMRGCCAQSGDGAAGYRNARQAVHLDEGDRYRSRS